MYSDDSLSLHTDLYQINMMQVYFNKGIHQKKAVFEAYFRKEPFENGYAVFAGLERLVHQAIAAAGSTLTPETHIVQL